MSPHLQTCQELSDITSPWALHFQEGLMKISHGVVSLGCEDVTNHVPLFPCGGKIPDVQDDRVGEVLAHEVASHFVLTVPLLGCQLFCIHGVVWILGNRTCVGAIEVAPLVGVPYCPLNMSGKYCPVGTFRSEVWDFSSQSN